MSNQEKFTREQLRKLKEAYASGALRVRHGDLDITYQSLSEMRQAIEDIEKELGIKIKKIRFSTMRYDKGL